MKIIWTFPAKFRLKEIYLYHKHYASLTIAKKLKQKIFSATHTLIRHPKIGQEEELLKHKQKEYRYLVQGNYKIIYKIDKDIIYVEDVFDCRQNPNKLLKISQLLS